MIKLINVNKSFGNKQVLENINLEFFEGESYAIMGRSGIGKTTLISLITGLLKPDSGEVNCSDVISIVFQEDRLINHLSTLENLVLVNNNEEECIKIIKNLGLSADINTKVSKLSGGMKRRVSIGRALAYPHRTLILDEPFKGLDNDTKTKVINTILEIEIDKTIILVTHSIDEAFSLNCKLIQIKSDVE